MYSTLGYPVRILVLSRKLVFLPYVFFKQKTAYEMRISDWSSDVCSSDLTGLCNNYAIPLAQSTCNDRYYCSRDCDGCNTRAGTPQLCVTAIAHATKFADRKSVV